ncbi:MULTISPECIES: hypothetical protein [Aerococcus]|uniref:Phage protein n=1 Tax=Aerococcus tenax TaxID=3078812 RepID=A0A329NCR1_9LACT|nr:MULTISPECIES: hypothetical protein [Aerococcus]MDL5184716.1 hypothetical protein [Aerococcus mictus]KAA9238579.1 hypothetical protein F6I34_08010 [Aerococcus urinae]MDK6371992.1 hypothetical protein [Aerococcus urinae]MDK7302432.1 hypothetical protein [Aerococcus urinae]MDK7802291.1 hypothetical protein [Aerococcus urinae]
MGHIKGVPVVLITQVANGVDPFGQPIYEEKEIVVDNVLIAPTLSQDVLNQLNITGDKAVYTLAIPKGDQNQWQNQKVKFFGKTWRVIGMPLEGIESMIPLDWNKKVMVEAYG